MGQILVRVKDISLDENGHPTELSGTERTITYKAYRFTEDKYQLLYQVDESGNPVEGSPNLLPEHRQVAQKSVAHAVNVVREPVRLPEENKSQPEVKQPVKRGPKPKDKTLIEHTA